MNPPKYIIWLLDHLLKEIYADEIIGDLYEWCDLRSPNSTYKQMHFYALKVLFGSFRLRKLKSTQNILKGLTNSTMANNQLRMSVKALLNNKLFTAINLIGLTISFTAFIFIYSYISYEKSYDQFHSKKENIYRVIKNYKESGEMVRSTPSPLANAFLQQFDGSIQFARFGQDPVVSSIGKNNYYEENFYWGDSSIFTTFTIPFKYGDPENVLKGPNSVVISASTAKKYFGDINPVGQTLQIKVYDGNADYGLKIDGVFEDLPANSDLPFELVGSIQNAFDLYKQFNNHWGFNWLHTYAVIQESDLSRIQAGIPLIIEEALGPDNISKISFYFQPLKEVHLYSNEISGSRTTGNIDYVITLSFIAIAIIIIAAFNYLNMMASTVNKRRKYVAINKILGAGKRELFSQFILESLLAVSIAFGVGIVLTFVLWPFYQSLIAKPIPIDTIYQLSSIGIYLLIILSTCLIASLQPAFILSKIKGNTSAIRNNIRQKLKFQRILVATQFAIAVFLICGTFTIYKQVQFAVSESLGFDSDQLVSIKVEDRSLQSKITDIKNELLSIPGVQMATLSGESLPSEMNNTDLMYWNEDSKNHPVAIHEVSADHNFFDLLDIRFLTGRSYLANNLYQENSEVVINEAAKDLLGINFEINQEIFIGQVPHKVVGVVENYHYNSFKSKIEPVVYFQTKAGSRLSYDNIIVRVAGSDISQTLGGMEKVWKSFAPDEFFTFYFVDQTFDNLYTSDQKFLSQFSVFAGLGILITCLGLLGMILFMADQRAKEISMRKVLGSTRYGILQLIFKQFALYIGFGLLIGLPSAIYFSKIWKEQFVYQIPFNILDAIVPSIVVILISILTIGRSALKISSTNPIKYLRNE
ncbi:ABC transporter permease [Marinoscillum pacificum]|uniref:ABC transporter permease n=1 Tax=Marinoscillum pacificum TaxID=392723 RepID=UPI002157EB82|nr:ABC transporter permease [Marinoscillum pacificum]